MELVTIQRSAQGRAEAAGYLYQDTTVKGGMSIWAPTWDMVSRVKDYIKGIGDYSEADYTRDYKALIRKRFEANPQPFRDFCRLDRVAIMCYCPAGSFCHRYIMVDILEMLCTHWGIPFKYNGELR